MAGNSTLIPAFLVSWIQIIAPNECFEELFVNFNLLHGPCLKILISKCLGYAIILGSCIVKVPQVVKILKAKSGEGISLASCTFELMAISASWAYGVGNKFPFSSYGEALFLCLQTTAISFLVLLYSDRLTHGLVYVSSYVGAMGFLLSPAAPLALLSTFQACNIFIIIASKLIQATANFKNSSTGQLSVVTVFLLFIGAIARVFTSLQETGDNLVVATYVISSICNGVIFSQIIYYRKSSAALETKKEL